MLPKRSDEELIAQYYDGSASAFDVIMERYRRHLVNFFQGAGVLHADAKTWPRKR